MDGSTKLFTSSPSQCPSSAATWSPDPDAVGNNLVDASAQIEVKCSQGRNTCPDGFPYAYDYGRHCCNSPIYNSHQLTGSTRVLQPTDVEACPRNADGTANQYGPATCTGDSPSTFSVCFGDYVKCPLLPGTCRGDQIDDAGQLAGYDYPPCNRCRTNHASPLTAPFQALSNTDAKYEYEKCDTWCNHVYLIKDTT